MRERCYNMSMKIHEVIVVEGKNDREKILSCVSADVIITNGLHIDKGTLDLLKKLNKQRGLIIFTDPDFPGRQIRDRIESYVGPCKHAHIAAKDGRAGRKVGIEHASCDVILKSLERAQAYAYEKSADTETITYAELIDLGLVGAKDSQAKRDLLAHTFSFPESNAKTCLKYLNLLEIDKETCENILGDGYFE